jgi:hypothetical protein
MFGLRLCWGSDVRGINVLVRPANFFHVCPVSFRVTEIEEVLVSAVGAFNATRMLDRTPMLFRPGGNLGEIGEDAVDIGAIIAIQLLGKVEIAQAMAVEGKVFPAMNLRYSINRKTNRLVHGADQVGQSDWDDAQPNDWRRQQNEKAGT